MNSKQPRLPGVVNRVHQMLCALGALLVVLAGKMEQYAVGPDDLSVAQSAAAVGAIWWGLLARRLLRRSQPQAIFTRDYRIGCVAMAVGVGLCGYTMVMQGGAIVRVLLVVAFLVAAYVWLSRQPKALAFWFPQERAGREKPEQNLAPGRNWRTLVVFIVYLFAWYPVLGVAT